MRIARRDYHEESIRKEAAARLFVLVLVLVLEKGRTNEDEDEDETKSA